MSTPAKHTLPFADAATIVRANQKDSYFLSTLKTQLQDVLSVFRGQKFVHTNPDEIAVATKVLYFLVTTALGARTLGEEYVDILYVTRDGKQLAGRSRRLLFTALYTLGPFIVTRIMRKFRTKGEESPSWLSRTLSSYPKLLDTMLNVHVALFYFQGLYYSLAKRILGMKYAFGHNKSPEKLLQAGNYSFLGVVMLLQFAVKLVYKMSETAGGESEAHFQPSHTTFSRVKQLEDVQMHADSDLFLSLKVNVTLLDPGQLPYIPTESRSCMLCLSPMTNPAAANCGHIFCWGCIVDWIRDHPECPLCRQQCLEQNLLPLR